MLSAHCAYERVYLCVCVLGLRSFSICINHVCPCGTEPAALQQQHQSVFVCVVCALK